MRRRHVKSVFAATGCNTSVPILKAISFLSFQPFLSTWLWLRFLLSITFNAHPSKSKSLKSPQPPPPPPTHKDFNETIKKVVRYLPPTLVFPSCWSHWQLCRAAAWISLAPFSKSLHLNHESAELMLNLLLTHEAFSPPLALQILPSLCNVWPRLFVWRRGLMQHW